MQIKASATRLGEFSPIRRLFRLGSCLIMTAVVHLFGLQDKKYALISTKMGWVKFWAIFSQTRLVTLIKAVKYGIKSSRTKYSRPDQM
jgi:hypothetical protein